MSVKPLHLCMQGQWYAKATSGHPCIFTKKEKKVEVFISDNFIFKITEASFFSVQSYAKKQQSVLLFYRKAFIYRHICCLQHEG